MPDKAAYNKLLKRFDKAVKWFNDPATSEADKDKFEPEFLKIIDELAAMAEEFIRTGTPMTDTEITCGFKAA